MTNNLLSKFDGKLQNIFTICDNTDGTAETSAVSPITKPLSAELDACLNAQPTISTTSANSETSYVQSKRVSSYRDKVVSHSHEATQTTTAQKVLSKSECKQMVGEPLIRKTAVNKKRKNSLNSQLVKADICP